MSADRIRPQLQQDMAESVSPDQAIGRAFQQGFEQGAKVAIATVGHHLGNELVPIRGYAELMRDDQSLTVTVREKIKIVHQGAVQASRIIHQLQRLKKLKVVMFGGQRIFDLNEAPEEER